MPLPCLQTLSIGTPQHRPHSPSALTSLLQHSQGRDTPQHGLGPVWSHISSMCAVSHSSHVTSALGRTEVTHCLDPPKAAFAPSSVRAHTEAETIAGSRMAPLPYPSCPPAGHCLASPWWTQSLQHLFGGLKPTQVMSNGLYPARELLCLKPGFSGQRPEAFWSFSSGADDPCLGASL